MKVVLDTNVLYAAFASQQGVCASVLRHCLARHEIVLSDHILEELRRHLMAKRKLSSDQVAQIITALEESALVVVPAPLPADVCRDPSDVPILGTAVSAKASVIVTGDKDLLSLAEYREVALLSPRTFHDRFAMG